MEEMIRKWSLLVMAAVHLCRHSSVVKPVKISALISKDRAFKLHPYLRSSLAAMERRHSVLKRSHS